MSELVTLVSVYGVVRLFIRHPKQATGYEGCGLMVVMTFGCVCHPITLNLFAHLAFVTFFFYAGVQRFGLWIRGGGVR